jgi:hypothetical protein
MENQPPSQGVTDILPGTSLNPPINETGSFRLPLATVVHFYTVIEKTRS